MEGQTASSLIVGVPRETAPGERRVAMTPDTVKRLLKDGHAVVVGTGLSCPAADAYGTGGNFGTPGRSNPPCVTPDASADGAETDVLITPG